MASSASVDLDLELMRASLLLESDPPAAARRARRILDNFPAQPEATLLYAAACRKLGDPAAAAAALELLAEAHRDTPFIQLELGRAYAALGQGAEAAAAFRRAVAVDPGLADAWAELATQLFAAGATSEGDAAYAECRRLTPDPPELNDVVAAVNDNRLAVAETLLRGRLEQAPHDIVALRMLAEATRRREDFAEAERRLNECLALAPGYAAARFDLAHLLYTSNRHAEVLPLIDRVLASDPYNVEYTSLKAQTLRFVGRNDEAVSLMKQLVVTHPDEDNAWLLRGHLLREIGQRAEAIEMYRQALALRPQSGRAYESLANLKTFRFNAADLTAMKEQLAHGGLRGSERMHLEFALGKALEDEGEFEGSFQHYARGNALHRVTLKYDADAVTADARGSNNLYAGDFFPERAGWGSGRRDPIFIVGLPRSGSTLLEQILASHSHVEGTRELFDLPALAFELDRHSSAAGRPAYPELLATIRRQEIDALAARYLSQTQSHRPLGKPRFVDKMLGNFCHLGLIHLMFPGAAIIDARRHPLGCGLSCYKQLFTGGGIQYSYDMTEMGRYYRDYAEVMEHFDAVLPTRAHRVHYERLIADPEAVVRELLDYCGLPFEEQCLRFYDNRRVVQTISSEQVRLPIYSGSVDQWRNFEPWLGPLKEPLKDLIDRYPKT